MYPLHNRLDRDEIVLKFKGFTCLGKQGFMRDQSLQANLKIRLVRWGNTEPKHPSINKAY